MTYKELAARYEAETGKKVSLSRISRRAKELKRLPTIEELKPRNAGRHAKF